MKKLLVTVLSVILVTGLYAYSQFIKKEIIQAVLQYQINLENPPNAIFAISTFDQKLSDGKNILRGTRFIGMVTKEESGYLINFNTIQTSDGKKDQFLGRSNLNTKSNLKVGGVSGKISKTLYERTQTNVLGAIFKAPNESQNSNSLILPQGFTIKIEID